MELLQCNLTESADAAAAVALVADYAAANPDEEWILGGGWSMDHFAGRCAAARRCSTPSCPTGRCCC